MPEPGKDSRSCGYTIRLLRSGCGWYGVLLDDALNATPFSSTEELWKLLEQVDRNGQSSESTLEQLRRAADTDYLTGVLNRRGLEQAIERMGQNACDAALFLDIDDFKRVNDRLGHDAGDQVLQQVAAAVRGCVRRDDMVARVGGDEFVILFRSMGTVRALGARAQEILTAVAELESGVTVSVGAAFGPGLGNEALIHWADQAMYQVKTNGKDGFAVWRGESEHNGAGP